MYSGQAKRSLGRDSLMHVRTLTSLSATVMIALTLSGCGTQKYGNESLNSRYVHSVSTVTPMKNVSASAKTTSFGLTCGFSREQYEAVYDEALSQVPGANILLDYTTDYETTFFPLICFNKVTVTGLAAQADVE
jgi:hypothetical protein